MHQQSLNLYPFFLLVCEIISTLSFLDFFIEFVNDNRDEQVHDEESSEENVYDEYQRNELIIVQFRHVVDLSAINSRIHHVRPHFKSCDFKKGHHGIQDVVVTVEWKLPLHLLGFRSYGLVKFIRYIYRKSTITICFSLDFRSRVVTIAHLSFEELNPKDTKDQEKQDYNQQDIEQCRNRKD